MTTPRWLVTAAPHLAARDSTPKIMWNVVFSLVPIVAAAIYFFGLSAILVLAAATLGALLPEWIWGKKRSLFDGSAVITGLLLGLTLPPGFPCWMAFVGGFFGLAFGKLVFGGLGQNPFNPALLGRAFLQAAFPVAITTWPKFGGGFLALKGDNLALPLMSPDIPDLVTEATPLGLMKFEHVPTGFSDLFFGYTGGSLGETSALLILVCGGYLALRNYLNWRIPASIFATVAVFSGVLYLIDSKAFPTPIFMLFSGGLMLGAVYMATDMVTSPTSSLGCWVFGLGIGVLVVIIRLWGGYPEGVMYAILLMNCLVGFINRVTHPRLFGSRQ
ncbi:MAG: RnfABCDGE type electron transport complex subunit D, partial [Planctomycetota bacterium]